MKKITLVIACLLFCINAFCQSFNLKELMNLPSQKDLSSYLIAKSFKLLPVKSSNGHIINFYIINQGTIKAEKVNVEGPTGKYGASVQYDAADSTYINSLIKEIKKTYPLVIKDFEPKFDFYQFGDTHLFIYVNIDKTSRTYNTISIVKKN